MRFFLIPAPRVATGAGLAIKAFSFAVLGLAAGVGAGEKGVGAAFFDVLGNFAEDVRI